MGVVQTGAIYKGFTFDGINSKTYGVYISGEAVYNSPERDVEMIEIPGRNGAFALDKGRFTNITVTYPAGLFGGSEADFAQGISDLRNALASRKGYCRLEDEYNPTEYRLAVYRSGLDVDPAQLKAGEFEIVFDCKPQRFLKSGEIPRTIGGSVTNPQTKSGAVVSIDSDGGDKATSLIANIEAVQTGSGDPSPTNVRAITGWTEAKVFDTGKNLADESTAIGFNAAVTVDGGYISVTKNASSNYPAAHIDAYLRAGVTYTVSATCVQATAQARLAIRDIAPSAIVVISVAYSADGQRKSVTYTPTKSGMYRVALFSSWGEADTGTAIFTDVQCEIGSTATAYEPYTGTITTTALGRTVYGGTVDVVTGALTVNRLHAKWGEGVFASTTPNTITTLGNLTRFWLYVHSVKVFEALSVKCDRLKSIGSGGEYGDSTTTGIGSGAASSAASCWIKLPTADVGTTAASIKAWLDTNPIEITYPITPQTYNLTAQQVELLTGNNNVWADTGDISITYGRDPNALVNPTLFNSHPLLEVDGYGTISINGEEVVLHNEPVGRVQLGGGTSYKNIITYTFDQSQFNTGDFITVPDYRRTFQFDMVKPYGSGEIIDFQVTSMTAPDYIFSATKYQGSLTLLADASIFSVGTARTDSYNVVGKISYKNSNGTASEADFRATAIVAYDGNGSITFTAAKFATDASFTYTTVSGTAPNFYGDSTWQPVTSTAYIDLDIGEAYVIQGGDIIGINNVVDLPAELPTLKAGANTITYDNTFSQLKIVPRWWRV